MHPTNVESLTAAGIDVAVLANNHVMDWSADGLDQTLDVLHTATIGTVGAGGDVGEARAPAVVDAPSSSRVVVFGAGSTSSGIPSDWEAKERRPGIALLPDLSNRTVDRIAARVHACSRPGDVVVMSLHWGENWGYEISEDRRRFARRLIDRADVHVVHGHSSHHPVGIEVHRGRLILYGCGDLLTDYEGIRGHERYRGELGALYLPSIDVGTGRLRDLQIVPTKVERFRLVRPNEDEVTWLAGVLDREGVELGTRVRADRDGTLTLSW
jgi:poly-gamma-glutamate synthesis protein (capsule biosynthesis protein)